MKHFFRLLLSLLVLFSTILLWLIFLPVQFGGISAFVIVNGNSMEPLYHKGDLVITRRETTYRVGDIVTYYNKELKSPVIHRIVGLNGKVFVMRGDHNAWQDNIQPTEADVIGKAWVHLPEVGNWLAPFQTPFGFAALSALAIFLFLSMFIFQGKAQRFRRKKVLSGVRPVPISLTVTQGVGFMQKLGRQIEMFVFICLALFVVSLGLAILGFANPETISTPADVQLVNVGFFSYSGSGVQGLYDADGPQTGDPVFLKATCNVKVQFNYSLNGDPLSDVEGTISFKAETIASNGWKRTFPLLSSTKFSGSTTRIQANLNPCEIIQTLRAAEKTVQVRNPSYQLILTPEVNVSATAGLVPMQSTFVPRLTFYLDDRQMYVLREKPDDDALSSFKVESKVTTASVPNKIPLPGFLLDVRIARTLALMGLITSLGLGLFIGWSIYRATRQDPLLTASLRYGSLMVHLTQLPAPLAERELWVNSLDDLALLAERNATAILHLTSDTADDFFVEGNNVVYRVQISRRREK